MVSSNILKLKDIIMLVVEDIPRIIDSMDERHEWNSISKIKNNINLIFTLIEQISVIVHTIKETIPNFQFDDKEIVLAIVDIIDSKISIPYIPNVIKRNILSYFIRKIMNQVDNKWDEIKQNFKYITIKTKSKIIKEKEV